MFEVDSPKYIENWWALAIKGALAMLFGFMTLIWPQESIYIFVMLFGAFAFLSGIIVLGGVVTGSYASDQKWLALLEGGIGLLIGFITFFFPRLTVGTLLFLIALWAIVYGVVQIVSAVSLRDEIEHEWMLGFTGLLAILVGLVFLVFPVGALGTITFLLGMVAFVIGAVTIVFAVRLRKLAAYDETLVGGTEPG